MNEELNIGGLPIAKVEEIREQIPKMFTHDEADDELKELNREDPKAVLDFLVKRSNPSCDCKKHRISSLSSVMFAVYLYDLLTDTGLEWSDRQKSQLSEAFAEMAMGTSAFLGMMARSEKAIQLAIAVLEDSGAVVGGVDGMPAGIISGGGGGAGLGGLLAMLASRMAERNAESEESKPEEDEEPDQEPDQEDDDSDEE